MWLLVNLDSNSYIYYNLILFESITNELNYTMDCSSTYLLMLLFGFTIDFFPFQKPIVREKSKIVYKNEIY